MFDAVATVLSHLTDGAVVDSTEPFAFEPTPWGEKVNWDDVGGRLVTPELDELWPEDEVEDESEVAGRGAPAASNSSVPPKIVTVETAKRRLYCARALALRVKRVSPTETPRPPS